MRVNLDGEKKEYIKKEDNEKNREKRDNIDDHEKEHLKKRGQQKKKGKTR